MESIRKNYVLQVAYQVLNMCLPFVTSPYISRVLGAEKLGLYSYTFSIASIFILFINLGIEKYGSRSIAMVRNDKEKMNKTFSELFFLRLIVGIGMMSTYYWFSVVFSENKGLFAINGILLIGATIDINWFFFGIEKFKITVTRNFILKILTVICVFLFVKAPNDLWKYITIMVVGTVISQSIIWCFIFKYVALIKVNIQGVLSHLKPLIILFIASLAQSAYTYIDKIMIGSLGTMEQLGYCTNAYKIVAFPMSIITSLGVVMLPRMAMLYETNRNDKAEVYIRESMRYIMILACAMVAGMIAIGRDFAIIFWGIDFAISGEIVVIIAPIVLFMSWSDIIRNQYLIPKKRDREYAIAIAVGAIVNIGFNALLIPVFSAKGAAISTVLSYFVISAYQTYITRKEIPYFRLIKETLPYVGFGVVMCVCVRMVKSVLHDITIQGLIYQVICGALVYGGLVLSYLILKRDKLIYKQDKKI
jgi:Membrane protein involved in the export of O-antigen and teichoic acid